MSRDLQYYRNKMLGLRNALDVLLAEMEAEPSVQPRKRQNRKAERVALIVNGRLPKNLFNQKVSKKTA